MNRMQTLGLSPEEQMRHGLALLDDYEVSAVKGDVNEKYLAAGLKSCFTALWRQADQPTSGIPYHQFATLEGPIEDNRDYRNRR